MLIFDFQHTLLVQLSINSTLCEDEISNIGHQDLKLQI